MDDVFTYFVPLPDGIHEMVTPCADGFTVYIDSDLDEAHRIRAYNHAIRHIMRGDFEKENVQEIEEEAHR
jgi:hypothetical protein